MGTCYHEHCNNLKEEFQVRNLPKVFGPIKKNHGF